MPVRGAACPDAPAWSLRILLGIRNPLSVCSAYERSCMEHPPILARNLQPSQCLRRLRPLLRGPPICEPMIWAHGCKQQRRWGGLSPPRKPFRNVAIVDEHSLVDMVRFMFENAGGVGGAQLPAFANH